MSVPHADLDRRDEMSNNEGGGMSLTVDEASRDRALRLANVIRLARADLKAELAELRPTEARQRLADWIEERRPDLVTIAVHKLILWGPRVGADTADALLRKAQIRGGMRQLGELTDRQRTVLAREMRAIRSGR